MQLAMRLERALELRNDDDDDDDDARDSREDPDMRDKEGENAQFSRLFVVCGRAARESDLHSTFAPFGDILNVRLVMDKRSADAATAQHSSNSSKSTIGSTSISTSTVRAKDSAAREPVCHSRGKSRGACFVQFSRASSAFRALEELDGAPLLLHSSRKQQEQQEQQEQEGSSHEPQQEQQQQQQLLKEEEQSSEERPRHGSAAAGSEEVESDSSAGKDIAKAARGLCPPGDVYADRGKGDCDRTGAAGDAGVCVAAGAVSVRKDSRVQPLHLLRIEIARPADAVRAARARKWSRSALRAFAVWRAGIVLGSGDKTKDSVDGGSNCQDIDRASEKAGEADASYAFYHDDCDDCHSDDDQSCLDVGRATAALRLRPARSLLGVYLPSDNFDAANIGAACDSLAAELAARPGFRYAVGPPRATYCTKPASAAGDLPTPNGTSNTSSQAGPRSKFHTGLSGTLRWALFAKFDTAYNCAVAHERVNGELRTWIVDDLTNEEPLPSGTAAVSVPVSAPVLVPQKHTTREHPHKRAAAISSDSDKGKHAKQPKNDHGLSQSHRNYTASPPIFASHSASLNGDRNVHSKNDAAQRKSAQTAQSRADRRLCICFKGDISQHQLARLFSPFTSVCYINVKKGQAALSYLQGLDTGRDSPLEHSGVAFVGFSSSTEAADAQRELDGIHIDGSELSVNFARAAPQDSSSSQTGGSSGSESSGAYHPAKDHHVHGGRNVRTRRHGHRGGANAAPNTSHNLHNPHQRVPRVALDKSKLVEIPSLKPSTPHSFQIQTAVPAESEQRVWQQQQRGPDQRQHQQQQTFPALPQSQQLYRPPQPHRSHQFELPVSQHPQNTVFFPVSPYVVLPQDSLAFHPVQGYWNFPVAQPSVAWHPHVVPHHFPSSDPPLRVVQNSWDSALLPADLPHSNATASYDLELRQDPPEDATADVPASGVFGGTRDVEAVNESELTTASSSDDELLVASTLNRTAAVHKRRRM